MLIIPQSSVVAAGAGPSALAEGMKEEGLALKQSVLGKKVDKDALNEVISSALYASICIAWPPNLMTSLFAGLTLPYNI